MKQTAIALLMVFFFAAQATAEERTVLKEQMEKESYATGVTLVRNLKQQGGSFDLDLVIKGMRDEITGEKLLLTEEDLHITLTALQNELKKHQTRGVIEYPEAPSQARTPVRDEEQTLRALAIASISPPRESAQQIPVSSPSSFQTPAQFEAPVQEHTFASLAAQQKPQTNDNGTIQIVLSDLTRMHADYWLKSLPRQKQK
jgi:Domain amino terminal to FKBP-type peptidyl-prolyl isomerase